MKRHSALYTNVSPSLVRCFSSSLQTHYHVQLEEQMGRLQGHIVRQKPPRPVTLYVNLSAHIKQHVFYNLTLRKEAEI